MKIKELINSCSNQWIDEKLIYDYNFEVEIRSESKGTFIKRKWADLKNDDYYLLALRDKEVIWWEMPTTKHIIITYKN